MPDKTRWIGNPIGPWVDEHRGRRRDAAPATGADDPTSPGTATRRTTSRHYDLELDYDVDGNRLAARPCSTPSPLEDLDRVTPRPARARRRQGHSSTAGRPSTATPRQAGRHARRADPAAGRSSGRRAVRRPPAPDPDARPRRRGLGGARPTASSSPASRTAPRRGSPATTGPPTRRPTGSAVDRAAGLPRRRQRRARRAPPRRSAHDLGLRAGRADGDVPRDRADRPLRALDDRGAGADAAPCCPASLAGGYDAAFGRQPEMMELFIRALRALPVRALHRRGHRRRPRDPARGAGPVDLRRQLPDRRLGRRAAGRPRAGPPVVRQQPDRSRRWQDIWLHEGFACYAEWLWSEESGGPSAPTSAPPSTTERLADARPGPPARRPRPGH